MSTSRPPPDQAHLVHNELLCYAFTQAHNSTLTSLVDCIVEFYRPADTVDARELLWKHCESVLAVITSKKRRPAAPVDKQTARPFVEDICQWVCHIVNHDLYDDLPVKFYALDLRNTPPCKPEEVNVFSLAARLTALEEKFCQSETSTSTVPLPAHQAPRRVVQNAPQASNEPSTSAVPVASATGQKDTWSTVVKKPKRPKADPKRVRAAAQHLPVVVGTGANDRIKSCKPLKDVFVYGVDGSCREDAIKDHITKKGVQPKRVQRVSKDTWFRSSFRITVEEDNVQQVLQAAFWPDGVKCREWLRTIPKTVDDSDSPVSDAESQHGGENS